MKPLDKKTTKELEELTTPISNVINGVLDGKKWQIGKKNREWKKCLSLHACIAGWYHHQGVDCNDSKAIKAKLIELFGCRPTYHVKYAYRNMVWGFDIDGDKIVIYRDKRGFKIQCLNNANVRNILEKLYKILIGNKNNKKYCLLYPDEW